MISIESGDGLPGIAIDVYASYAQIHMYSLFWKPYLKDISSFLSNELKMKGVYIKHRIRGRPQVSRRILFIPPFFLSFYCWLCLFLLHLLLTRKKISQEKRQKETKQWWKRMGSFLKFILLTPTALVCFWIWRVIGRRFTTSLRSTSIIKGFFIFPFFIFFYFFFFFFFFLFTYLYLIQNICVKYVLSYVLFQCLCCFFIRFYNKCWCISTKFLFLFSSLLLLSRITF